ATQAGAALPNPATVTDSSLAPTDTATSTPDFEAETPSTDNAPLAPVDQSPQPDPPTQPEQAPQPDSTSMPQPEQAPAPQPDSAQTPELAPEPSLAPVLDVVRVTRRGVHVTVGINASDPDGDSLSLSVVGVLDSGGETFEQTADSDSGIFEMPFGPDSRGTVTVTTSVTDGVETTEQVDQIEIAPLQQVTVGPGEIVASKGCFIENDKLTFQPSSSISLLDTRGVSSNLHTNDLASPITLDLHNTGSQLFVTGISAEFEESEGFVSVLGLRGTLGDVDVHYNSDKVQPGRYQAPTFVSPSDPRCWVDVGYVITVQPAG
ncbi:MAG: hypothetical protein DRJ50_03785, partial [Actinobacteria bacterium]